MKPPTKKQIQDEIQRLRKMKPTVLSRNAFGESRHDAIDFQIDTLANDWNEDAVWERHNGAGEDEPIGKDNVRDAGLEAARWRNGSAENNKKPSDNWKELVR